MTSSTIHEAIGWLMVELQHICGAEDPVREIVLGPETYDALATEGRRPDGIEITSGEMLITPPMPNGRMLRVRRGED